MRNVLQASQMYQYADDTALYRSDINQTRNIRLLQLDLTRVVKWCNSNKLTINVRKTKVTHFGKTIMSTACPEVTINNIHLQVERTYKYLGVVTDAELKFKGNTFDIKKLAYNNIFPNVLGTI